MKTTEMFVEQILIGGALLFIVFLLFPDLPSLTIPKNWNISGPLVSALIGASALGAAYFFGILYDRVADTLLEDQEKRSRLRYALKRYKRTKVSFSEDDLFPVHILRLEVYDAKSGVSEHANYLRSRIRLLRALTTLIPALTVSYVIHGLMDEQKSGWQELRIAGTVGLFLIYGSVFLYKILPWLNKLRMKNKIGILDRLSKWVKRHAPPKTYIDRENIEEGIREHLGKGWAWRDPVFLGFWILIILSAILESSREKPCWILPFLGLSLTLLCGWAFLRVHKTFLSLLDNYHEYVKRHHLPAD